MPEAFDNSYPEGSYQRGYRDYLRKCAQDGTTSEMTQASAFYNGYKYALQEALRIIDNELQDPDINPYAAAELIAVRVTLRGKLI